MKHTHHLFISFYRKINNPHLPNSKITNLILSEAKIYNHVHKQEDKIYFVNTFTAVQRKYF